MQIDAPLPTTHSIVVALAFKARSFFLLTLYSSVNPISSHTHGAEYFGATEKESSIRQCTCRLYEQNEASVS